MSIFPCRLPLEALFHLSTKMESSLGAVVVNFFVPNLLFEVYREIIIKLSSSKNERDVLKSSHSRPISFEILEHFIMKDMSWQWNRILTLHLYYHLHRAFWINSKKFVTWLLINKSAKEQKACHKSMAKIEWLVQSAAVWRRGDQCTRSHHHWQKISMYWKMFSSPLALNRFCYRPKSVGCQRLPDSDSLIQ